MSKPVRTPTMAAIVVEATRLSRSIRESEEKLKDLKASLRKEAEKVAKRRDSDELVEFESAEGTATVCFVKDTVALIKGADPSSLQGVISDEVWDILFDTKYVLKSEFEDKLAALPKQTQAKVKPIVDWFPNAPRVILPK
jgi:hypothetical protein